MSYLNRALYLLDNLPPGAFCLKALVLVQKTLLPLDHPFRGRLRNGYGVVWWHGIVVKTLPNPQESRQMATRAMEWLNKSLQDKNKDFHPLAIAAEIVFLVLQAHPFWDGNGRVARALGTWVLLRSGYELVIDPGLYCRTRTDAYYRALLARHQSRPGLWHVFFANMVDYCFKSPREALNKHHV